MTNKSAQLALAASRRGHARLQTIDGELTKYWFYPAKTTAAKTIIFIHGYRGNHRGLEAIAGALEDFEIFIPDLPGFGASAPLNGEHSIAHYSQWLDKFIHGLNLSAKPILLGHSFGTIVCSHFAATNPRSISKLVLVNPVSAPALEGPKAGLTKIAILFFWLAAKLPVTTADWLLKSWPMVRGMSIVMTKSKDKTLRAWVHRQHDDNFNDFAELRVAIEGYHASISSCVADFAASFEMPTMFIAGDRDDITSVAQQQKTFATVKANESRLEVIHGVGHLTHYETPERVADLIRSFAGGSK
jgi:pimeloyl-ACP methyl ester carboxylesterase